LAERVRRWLGVAGVRLTGGERLVKRVAVCVGAGESLFEGVEADAYVTGEMRHHAVLDLAQRGRAVVLAGHTHTERPYLPVYAERIAGATGGAVEVVVSASDACPWIEHPSAGRG
jgi:putative NIF3 family GTP cyclohydrolase 1 type 2